MQVIIEGGHVKFTLDLSNKISIISGLSAKHKTWMVTAVDAGEPAYKISVSNGDYGLQVLRKNNWDGIVLANSLRHYKMVYFVDDQDFVESKDFAQAIKEDRENYFVIINRVSGLLPVDVRSVYSLVSNGKEHFLKQLYNIPFVEKIENKDIFFVEDSTSGLKWFQMLAKGYNVETTDGAPNIAKCIAKNKNMSLSIAADLFGLGYYIPDIEQAAIDNKVTVKFLKDYGSFEYLLLRSNLFRYQLTEEDILESMSKEIACEKVIDKLTAGKYYKYSKSSNLNFCYYKDCCAHSRKDKCDKGLTGNKFEAMLKGTEFEYLLNFRNVQNKKPKTASDILDSIK